MSRLACSPVLPNSIGTNMMTMVTTKKTRAKTDLFTLSKNNDNNDDNVTIKTMLTCSPVPKGIQLWSLPPMMERPRGPPDLKMTIVDNADDNDANDDDDEELDKEDGGDSNGDDDNGDGRDVKP